MSGIPPPPPPPPGHGPPPPPPPPGGASPGLSTLPQINIPKPRSKMKTLQWQKIPVNNVIGKANIWTIIGRLEKKYEMDYEKMEELFSLKHDSGSKRSGQDIDGVTDHKKKRENTEINILDGKRSLNVNIFLKQFRMEHEEIVRLLREGRCEKFGPERLRSLLKLLPSQEEIDAINGYKGDIDKLGNAEKFFTCLMKLPNYRMRTEGLLIMEEFNVNMEWIRPSIEAVIQAAKDIQDSQSLRELICLILLSGNYLNSGNYAGNAAGFKLSSLLKLTEIRANKPKMNLLHFVAQEAEVKNPKLLNFPEEMACLKDAAQVSIETLTTDINNIASKVKAITEQIVMAGQDFQQQMSYFLKVANVEVAELEEDLQEIETIRLDLATFFCEDTKTFRLEECFTILQTFCERLKKATEENIQRRIQNAKSERRRQSKETKANQNSVTEPLNQVIDHNMKDEEGAIVDKLLADVRTGFTSRKFNDGNFSVTKVSKVNLCPTDTSPGSGGSMVDSTDGNQSSHSRMSQRGSHLDSSLDSPFDRASPTPDSLGQKRNRRSYATDDDDSLLEYLMDTADSSKDSSKSKPDFDHYASLRKRRLERKAKQSVLEVLDTERERAPSPSDLSTPDVHLRHNKDNGTSHAVVDRRKSEGFSTSRGSRMLHRSRSWLDRPSVEKANLEHKKIEDMDESDALIKRLKQRLSSKSGRYTPTITEEGGDEPTNQNNSNSSLQDNTQRRSSRLSSGILASGNSSSPLETIYDTSANGTESALSVAERTKGKSSVPQKSSLGQLQNSDNNTTSHLQSQDDCDLAPSVMVSMRKRISSGIGTDIDRVLKTIEGTGRPIDTVGVTGPIQRTADANSNKTPSQSQVAVVAHFTASNIPSTPIREQDLKAKRDKRKKRSTLSADDVKAAMKISGPPNNNESINNSPLKNVTSCSPKSSNTSSKTPPTQRRLHSSSDKTNNEKDIEVGNSKDLNKAAKLAAARKKFRGARFGNTGNTYDTSRARSNVESDSVDQALKEIASQSNMSRSKSYDEHVAKMALKSEDNFSSNSIMKTNSNSAPDTSDEKCAILRSSLPRLDGRRNGVYIPSDDSDTELKPEDIGTRRSSKSDRPKSFSQLSLKSVNTSTETIPADNESSVEQNIKSINSQSSHSINTNPSVIKPTVSVTSSMPVSDTNISNDRFTLRRSYSLIERHKNIEEDSENPLAAMAKWRVRRVSQRRSVYDNVYETEAALESIHSSNNQNTNIHCTKTEENDLKNEIGSRSSYASSNDKDEGFESASGTLSQRTSMNSNLDAEMYSTPTLSRRADNLKSKSTVESSLRKKPVVNASQENDSVISRLSEEADRKERTESWTEQTVRVNTVSSDSRSDKSNTVSPDSGHSTSREDIWSEDAVNSNLKSTTPTSPIKQTSTANKTPNTEDATKSGKSKSVPSYMLPTSSSANKPVQNRHTSNTNSDSPTLFTRDTPNRISTRDQQFTSPFKRDSVRASMRAETATASFQRGTAARTSMRGPRTSIGSPKSSLTLPSPGRTRSDSNASISSTTSGTSNISTTPSTVSESARRRLTPSTNSGSSIHGRPTTPSGRPNTPSGHQMPSSGRSRIHSDHSKTLPNQPTTPTSRSIVSSPRAFAPASHSNPSNLTAGIGLTRTQSMRATSARTSLGTDIKHSTPVSNMAGRRSITPLIDKSSSTSSLAPERPQSTTPMSSENKSSRRSSFMAPTASSRAKVEEQAPVAPPRTKSLRNSSSASSLSRSGSLRMPNNSGRESPAHESILHKPEHHQSLSTVTEVVGEEEREKNASKKSSSFFQRLSSAKSRVSHAGNMKSSIILKTSK